MNGESVLPWSDKDSERLTGNLIRKFERLIDLEVVRVAEEDGAAAVLR